MAAGDRCFDDRDCFDSPFAVLDSNLQCINGVCQEGGGAGAPPPPPTPSLTPRASSTPQPSPQPRRETCGGIGSNCNLLGSPATGNFAGCCEGLVCIGDAGNSNWYEGDSRYGICQEPITPPPSPPPTPPASPAPPRPSPSRPPVGCSGEGDVCRVWPEAPGLNVECCAGLTCQDLREVNQNETEFFSFGVNYFEGVCRTPPVTPPVTPSTTPPSTPGVTPSRTPPRTPPGTPPVTPSRTPPASPGVTPSRTPPASPGVTPSRTPPTTPPSTPAVSQSRTPPVSRTPAVSNTPEPSNTPAPTRTPAPSPLPIYGCTDPSAENYEPLAQVDDGTCTYRPTWKSCLETGLKDGNAPSDWRLVVDLRPGGDLCWEPVVDVGFEPAFSDLRFRYQRGSGIFPAAKNFTANNPSYGISYRIILETDNELFNISPNNFVIEPRSRRTISVSVSRNNIELFGDGTTDFNLIVTVEQI